MFDSVESLPIVNETEIYILPALYVCLNYCCQIANSFPGNFSCHKATLGFIDHKFDVMFVSFENQLQ